MVEQTTQGLRLVEGESFETLTEKLKDAKIPFDIIKSPHRTHSWFRYSSIGVKHISDILPILGEPGEKNRHYSGGLTLTQVTYHGKYEITPAFNLTNLNENPTFENGRLIEEVSIVFPQGRL